MQGIKFEAGLRLQSPREHAVHLEGKRKLTLRESSVVLPASHIILWVDHINIGLVDL
jgi:hypothetical protein